MSLWQCDILPARQAAHKCSATWLTDYHTATHCKAAFAA
nr:MAG TPA: hypothetical protein [Caudoviricetes sp.]